MKSLVKTILGPERAERVARALRGLRASTPVDSATLHRELESVKAALGDQLAARQAERLADRRDAADQADALVARLDAIDAKVDALAEHVRTITADLAGRVADLDAERPHVGGALRDQP